jgi:hypothetical protein
MEGGYRIECWSIAEHAQAHRWIEALGLVRRYRIRASARTASPSSCSHGSPMQIVRLPLDRNEDAYVELARQAVEESAREVGFNPTACARPSTATSTARHPTIFVVEQNRELVGFMNATISEYTFADGIFTTQEVMFIRPDKRGTRAAASLVRHFTAGAIGSAQWRIRAATTTLCSRNRPLASWKRMALSGSASS